MKNMSKFDWVCVVCGKEAMYRTEQKCYCGDHWNFGEPWRAKIYAENDVNGGKQKS
jgi:hypothetical protein